MSGSPKFDTTPTDQDDETEDDTPSETTPSPTEARFETVERIVRLEDGLDSLYDRVGNLEDQTSHIEALEGRLRHLEDLAYDVRCGECQTPFNLGEDRVDVDRETTTFGSTKRFTVKCPSCEESHELEPNEVDENGIDPDGSTEPALELE